MHPHHPLDPRRVPRSLWAAALLAFATLPTLAADEAAARAAVRTTPDFAAITKQYGPAVVNISVSGVRRLSTSDADPSVSASDDRHDPMLEFLQKFQEQFGATGISMQVPVHALGSGFVLTPDGLVLTNAHVVADAAEVIVKLTDRREFTARVLGSDRRTDVAVLKIDAKDLPAVRLGNPANLQVGEWVLAIGAPFGFENSVSAGVVSAKGRALPDEDAVTYIQTDAAINPGNSGGPLFNVQGEVIGINAQIYTRSGGFQGLGFAIPIDLAARVAAQIVRTGRVQHGRLGVSVQEIDQTLADAFGLPRPAGALISGVAPGSPAAAAKLRVGDVVTAVDGQPVGVAAELSAAIATGVPGQQLKLDVWRDRRAGITNVVLGDAAAPPTAPDTSALDGEERVLGMAIRALRASERVRTGGETGLLVEAVAGPSLAAGVQPGDIVVAVNATTVETVAQARRAVAAAKGSLALLVKREGETRFVPVRGR